MIKNNYLRLCAKKLIYSIKEIMKKILILAYDFPPYVSVGGLRPYSWYKYLHEFDVYPIVITRQWNNKYGNHLDYIAPSDSNETIIEKTEKGTIIKTPYKPNFPNRIMLKYGENKYKLIRKFFSAYFELAQHIFTIGPKLPLYLAAEEFLRKNKVDAIIASGDPFILFKYASKLSNKFNIPWIADYRDPWSQGKLRSSNGFLKYWNIYFEKKHLKNAVAITTVSDFFKDKIKGLIKNKTIYIIKNGFDPETVEKLNELKQKNNYFSIAFAGSIYKWHPLELFLHSCCEFIKKNNNIKFQINYYGINNEIEIKKLIQLKFHELEPFIHFYSKLPNQKLLDQLKKENILLLFNDYSIIGTKIYDYISIKRLILLCFSEEVEANKLKKKYFPFIEEKKLNLRPQEELIKQTNSGYIVKNSKELINLLNQLYEEFSANGYIHCNTIDVENYSRKNQTKNLAEIIKKIETVKSNIK